MIDGIGGLIGDAVGLPRWNIKNPDIGGRNVTSTAACLGSGPIGKNLRPRKISDPRSIGRQSGLAIHAPIGELNHRLVWPLPGP